MATTTLKRKFTPPELAEMWGINPDKVIAWIQSGELKAINGATRRGGRPRYLIDEDAIADFERDRSVVADEKPAPRVRKQDTTPEYV